MIRLYKMSGIILLSALLVSGFSLSASAQAPTGRKYKLNALVHMDWQTIEPETGDDTDIEKFMANFGLGIFVNDIFEVGPEITYSKFKVETGGAEVEMSAYSLGAKGNVHFNTGGATIPYFGLNVAFSSIDNDEDDSTFTYGAQAGLDYFVTEHMSINPELRYTMGTYDFGAGDEDISDMILFIGIAGHF